MLARPIKDYRFDKALNIERAKQAGKFLTIALVAQNFVCALG